MMAEPSGSFVPGPSVMRSPAGNPLACRSAHMAGSHETTAVWLTCVATHAAACCLAAVAALTAPEPAAFDVLPLPWPATPWPPPLRSSATVRPPAANTTSTTTIAAITRHRLLRRCAHSRTVVPTTAPHDGATSEPTRAATGWAARRSISELGLSTIGPVTGSSGSPCPGGDCGAGTAGSGREAAGALSPSCGSGSDGPGPAGSGCGNSSGCGDGSGPGGSGSGDGPEAAGCGSAGSGGTCPSAAARMPGESEGDAPGSITRSGSGPVFEGGTGPVSEGGTGSNPGSGPLRGFQFPGLDLELPGIRRGNGAAGGRVSGSAALGAAWA
jgi:hypothetical protein